MKRIYYLDLSKGITIISVALFHMAESTDPNYYYYNYLQLPGILIYSFIMPLFFMVSAVLLRKKLERIDFSNITFLKKIISNILIPFYTLSFLFYFINLIFRNPSEANSFQETIQALLYKQTIGDNLPSGVLWFLFILFLFALITFVFIKILRINIYILFILSVLLKLIDSYFPIEFNYFAFHKIIEFYVFYTSGYLLSDHILKGKFISNNISIMSYFICWIITFYFTFIIKIQYIHNILVSFGICGISGSLFILAFSHKISNSFSSNVLTDFLCFCGVNSILIYVFHTPTIYIIRKLLHHFNFSDSIWIFLFIFLCSIFFPLIYGKFLSYNRFMYKLLLGRNP